MLAKPLRFAYYRYLSMGEETRPNEEVVIHGIGVSPGVARGHAHVGGLGGEFEEPETYTIPEDAVQAEIDRLKEALQATRKELSGIQEQIAEAGGPKEAAIFDAHLLVLEDPSIINEVFTRLKEEKHNVESIYFEVVKRYMGLLRNVDDVYLRERVIDVEDVARRVIANLLGARDDRALPFSSQPFIQLAHDLTPSETATMNRDLVLGFVTEGGSYTSHTAIMARSFGLPAVVGVHAICNRIHTGDEILIDGDHGVIVLNPSEETAAKYKHLEDKARELRKQLEGLREEKSRTSDGSAVTLSANIEFPDELSLVLESGADGIGLFRTEFLCMRRGEPPLEEAQFEQYRRAAEAMGSFGVIIRTFDVGGDKLLSRGEEEPEPNPFLGWRGIRVSLKEREVFKAQLRAILRASAFGKTRLLYPLVSGVEELKAAAGVLEECKTELRREGQAFDEDIEVGAMIEVPSAAVTCDILAEEVDFFSIGTNDLIQYSIAVDRGNERVADLYQPAHPGVLRLINMVVAAARNAGIWVGFCGEMAGDILFTPLLVGAGIEELSVSAGILPRVKLAVRSLDRQDCVEVYRRALELRSAAQIVDLCQETARKHYPQLVS